MAEHFFEVLRGYFDQYGYWTLAVVLLLENAGVPVPGETVLLYASFLAYAEHQMRLPLIILIGTAAATVGDNIGYAIGLRGGRPLLLRYQHIFRIRQATLDRGERLFAKYGVHTVFFARFVFGMRIVAGPMAGVLRMEWRRFALFNFLGAALWVTVIASVGYLFGSQWERLLAVLKGVNLAIVLVVLVAALGAWFWHRRDRPGGDANGSAESSQE